MDYLGPPWDVADGQHAVDLDGRDATFGGIEQTFPTVAEQVYLVSFALSGNPQGGPTVKQVQVSVEGVTQEYAFDTSGQTVEGTGLAAGGVPVRGVRSLCDAVVYEPVCRAG